MIETGFSPGIAAPDNDANRRRSQLHADRWTATRWGITGHIASMAPGSLIASNGADSIGLALILDSFIYPSSLESLPN